MAPAWVRCLNAPEWGDAGSDTLGHILGIAPSTAAKSSAVWPLEMSVHSRMFHLAEPAGSMAVVRWKSNGKDTTTGHWEMPG